MSSVVQNSSHPSLSYADSMATSTSDTILLIGRVLLGWIFLRSGYGKIFDIPAYAATFPGRGLPTFLAYHPRARNPLRGDRDDSIHAGGHV